MKIISILMVCFLPCLSVYGQDKKWISREEATENVDLKKAYELLNNKLWVETKYCLDDTCKDFDPNFRFPTYNYMYGWSGRKIGDSTFLTCNFNSIVYLEDPETGENMYFPMGCKPFVTIKNMKSQHPLIFNILHVSEAGDYEMEIIFLDEKHFTLKGPAFTIGKNQQVAEYILSESNNEAKEIVKKAFAQ